MIGPVSVVSADPRWPTESAASTRKWNRAGTVVGTSQMILAECSPCPRPSACQAAPGWSGRQERETERGARCRSVARQAIATLPEFTPVPTCTGSSLHGGRRGVDLDPALGRVAGGGGLVAQARRRPRHQADPVCPLAAQVHVDGRDAVRVVAAANPGAAAVLGDPELDGRGPVGTGVVDGVLELEFGVIDQKGFAGVSKAFAPEDARLRRCVPRRKAGHPGREEILGLIGRGAGLGRPGLAGT